MMVDKTPVANIDTAAVQAGKSSLIRRLYRGDINFNFVGTRKRWYLASVILLLICTVSFVVRGFQFGIEFQGGSSFQFHSTSVSLNEAQNAVSKTGVDVASAQLVGSGGTQNVLIKTEEISATQEADVKKAISELGVSDEAISINSVSSSWGGDITRKAIIGLIVFLGLVCAFIAIRFEWAMAIAAIVALFHDLLLSAGVYSIVGFEVTPSTVVGLLTILGFSLYDTVVVFDKISENTKGILGGSRITYSQAANLAVNQTLMRSINTSLIALLPVAGLLFVGAGLLGVGTIKDLALVLFVGLASGAYSSLFLATPVLCDLKERDPKLAALRKRVLAKQAASAPRIMPTIETRNGATQPVVDHETEIAEPRELVGGTTPKPGVRPQRGKRPTARKSGRPTGKRRH